MAWFDVLQGIGSGLVGVSEAKAKALEQKQAARRAQLQELEAQQSIGQNYLRMMTELNQPVPYDPKDEVQQAALRHYKGLIRVNPDKTLSISPTAASQLQARKDQATLAIMQAKQDGTWETMSAGQRRQLGEASGQEWRNEEELLDFMRREALAKGAAGIKQAEVMVPSREATTDMAAMNSAAQMWQKDFTAQKTYLQLQQKDPAAAEKFKREKLNSYLSMFPGAYPRSGSSSTVNIPGVQNPITVHTDQD